MGKSMIQLDNVTYSYAPQKAALASISFAVRTGEILGMVGANGSGKSTLLALLAGLYRPDSGRIRVGGIESPGHEQEIRSCCRLVLQEADLQIIGATVGEDLMLGREGLADAEAAAKDMARKFDLAGNWEDPVHALSWGMKKKLCLAAALLDAPEVLLLDEPFSGLDYPGIREMRGMISRNRDAGLTQIVTAHDLECFVDLVDRMIVLETGRLVAFGQPEDVLDNIALHGVRPPCSWLLEKKVRPWDD